MFNITIPMSTLCVRIKGGQSLIIGGTNIGDTPGHLINMKKMLVVDYQFANKELVN